MPILATYEQQPADRLDYDIYFANNPDGSPDWLTTGDSISGVTFDADDGITVTEEHTTSRVKLWVSGGAHGSTYKVEVTITTAGGRIKQVEVRFKIRES